MNATALALSLAVSPLLLLGAPASFDVDGVEVEAVVTGDTARVLVAWDLEITDPACGYVEGELARLPVDAADRSVVIRLDARDVPGVFAEAGGKWRVGMDREGTRFLAELRASKRVRMEMTFSSVPVKDGHLDLALDALRPAWRREEGTPGDPPLQVRLVRRSKDGDARMDATFAKAAPGATLRLSAGEGEMGVRLRTPRRAAGDGGVAEK